MMKKKKIILLGIALVLLAGCILGICIYCDDITYRVTVKDALGKPIASGISVELYQGDSLVDTEAADENGTAEIRLPRGEYQVELKSDDETKEYVYGEDISVTAKNRRIEVIAGQMLTGEASAVFTGDGEYSAYPLSVGCTCVTLESGRTYFLFTPTEAGTYRFSVPIGEGAEIGYYGDPQFVHESSIAEIESGGFVLSVSEYMLDGICVLGVDSPTAQTAHIGIERIGEAAKTSEDVPRTYYQATAELKKYKLPEGVTLQEFDLTASTETYTLVYNEADGFYHLNAKDGPLVYVRLTKDSKYIDCFQTVLGYSGITRYFFDENGEITKREYYDNCLWDYIENVDPKEGVYPLTEDLKYIIQSYGTNSGWWDLSNPGYIFYDEDGELIPDINCEIAWLLMCCYAG